MRTQTGRHDTRAVRHIDDARAAMVTGGLDCNCMFG